MCLSGDAALGVTLRRSLDGHDASAFDGQFRLRRGRSEVFCDKANSQVLPGRRRRESCFACILREIDNARQPRHLIGAKRYEANVERIVAEIYLSGLPRMEKRASQPDPRGFAASPYLPRSQFDEGMRSAQNKVTPQVLKEEPCGEKLTPSAVINAVERGGATKRPLAVIEESLEWVLRQWRLSVLEVPA